MLSQECGCDSSKIQFFYLNHFPFHLLFFAANLGNTSHEGFEKFGDDGSDCLQLKA